MPLTNEIIERRIAGKLISQALAAGYVISVNDGEDWVLKASKSKKAILAAMFSTDSDTLMIRNPADKSTNNVGAKVAAVAMIYGNGADVISDYSAIDDAALDAFGAWLEPVTKYAEKFQ